MHTRHRSRGWDQACIRSIWAAPSRTARLPQWQKWEEAESASPTGGAWRGPWTAGSGCNLGQPKQRRVWVMGVWTHNSVTAEPQKLDLLRWLTGLVVLSFTGDGERVDVETQVPGHRLQQQHWEGPVRVVVVHQCVDFPHVQPVTSHVALGVEKRTQHIPCRRSKFRASHLIKTQRHLRWVMQSNVFGTKRLFFGVFLRSRLLEPNLLLLLTLVGFPADQQVQGVRHAKGVLLCQIVDRKGPPVPQCNSLAQQRSGGTHLQMLTLKNSQHRTCGQEARAPMQRPCTEATILHCGTAEVVQNCPGAAVRVTWLKEKKPEGCRWCPRRFCWRRPVDKLQWGSVKTS